MPTARAALAVLLLACAGCGDGPTRPDLFTENLAGTVHDSPTAAHQTHAIRVTGEGRLTTTLTWSSPPSNQPAGQALLALTLRDASGGVVLDTFGTLPTASPTTRSVPVSPQTYTLTVRSQFRERIGFYCLCDVAYTLVVQHP